MHGHFRSRTHVQWVGGNGTASEGLVSACLLRCSGWPVPLVKCSGMLAALSIDEEAFVFLKL